MTEEEIKPFLNLTIASKTGGKYIISANFKGAGIDYLNMLNGLCDGYPFFEKIMTDVIRLRSKKINPDTDNLNGR